MDAVCETSRNPVLCQRALSSMQIVSTPTRSRFDGKEFILLHNSYPFPSQLQVSVHSPHPVSCGPASRSLSEEVRWFGWTRSDHHEWTRSLDARKRPCGTQSTYITHHLVSWIKCCQIRILFHLISMQYLGSHFYAPKIGCVNIIQTSNKVDVANHRSFPFGGFPKWGYPSQHHPF